GRGGDAGFVSVKTLLVSCRLRSYDRCREANPRNNRSLRNCNWHGGGGQSEAPAFFGTRKSGQAMTRQHDIDYRYNNARRMTKTSRSPEPRTSPVSAKNSSEQRLRRLAVGRTAYYCHHCRDN